MLIKKEEARKIVKQNLNYLSFEQKKQISENAWNTLLTGKDCPLKLNEYKAVLSYYALKAEVQTDFFNLCVLQKGIDLFLPKTIDKHNMEFYKVSSTDAYSSELVKNSWGIAEPKETFKKFCASDYKKSKILVIVPGVAFKLDGQRLGHGNGYYDNYLSFLIEESKKYGILPELKGVCFKCQTDIDFECSNTDVNVGDVLVF